MTRWHRFRFSRRATKRPSPERYQRMYCWLAGAWLLPAAALAATWSVRDAPDGTVAKPRAVIVNSAGDELALFSDADGTVHLRFTIATAIVSLSRSSCPTFQIDRRLPLHHFAIDQACHIEHKTALIDLGQTQNLATPTVAIEQMMNGVQDRKSTRLNSSHIQKSRMPSSA